MTDTPKRDAGRQRQLPLDFELPPHFGRDDFLVSAANSGALRMIEAWPGWPDSLLLLIGARGTGKSHLAAIWAANAGATIIPADQLAEEAVEPLASKATLVIENAEAIGTAEVSLFHLINLMREGKGSLLLTTDRRPELWGLRTPDLLSRLRLAPAVELGMPDDALLNAVLVKLFCDRQMIVDAAVVDTIALHIDRSLDMARRVVALLDREGLARGAKVTKSMAREILRRLGGEDERG